MAGKERLPETKQTGQHPTESRLAGPIATYHRGDGSRFKPEVDIAEGQSPLDFDSQLLNRPDHLLTAAWAREFDAARSRRKRSTAKPKTTAPSRANNPSGKSRSEKPAPRTMTPWATWLK